MVQEPSETEMLDYMGKRRTKLWMKIKNFLSENYETHTPEVSLSKEGDEWTIRYRKSGKTLCTLHLKKKNFIVLMILGKREVVKFEELRDEFSPGVTELFDTVRQYHDGRWLFIKLPEIGNIEDIKKLLLIKRSPIPSTDNF